MNKTKSRNSFNFQKYWQDRLDYSRLQKPGKTLKIGDNQYVGYQPPKSSKGQTYMMVGQREYDPGPGGSGDGNKGTNRRRAYIPIWGLGAAAPAPAPVQEATAPVTPPNQEITSEYTAPTNFGPTDIEAPTPIPQELTAPMPAYSLQTGATGFQGATTYRDMAGINSRGLNSMRIRSPFSGSGYGLKIG